jgi:Uma2 family endonuclease
MARRGILTTADRVELLDGLLFQKMTKNPPHTLATQLTREAVERPLPSGWFVNVQEPVTLATSEPEPDVTVVRGERRQFGSRHPAAGDVVTLIEVADSSLAEDQGWKKQVYAAASIAIYWIINLVDRRVEVYTDPSGAADQPDYRQRRDYGPTDEVPLVLDGKEVARIPVRDLLP